MGTNMADIDGDTDSSFSYACMPGCAAYAVNNIWWGLWWLQHNSFFSSQPRVKSESVDLRMFSPKDNNNC